MSFLNIFTYDFMLRAFAAGSIIAIIAPVIGNFLVVRRYSLMSDTLAHVALAGVAVGLLTNTQPVLASVVVTVLASIGIELLRDGRRIYGESVLAIFLSGSLAIAVVLFSAVKGLNTNLFSFLFGSITTVSANDITIILSLGILALAAITLFYKELFFVSFDQELAQANGVRVRVFNMLLVTLAAITIVVSMRIVGALLVGALMVIPVVAAQLFARSFRGTILLSVLFSAFSVFTGLWTSYYLNLASGGTIVVVALLLFVMSVLVQRRR